MHNYIKMLLKKNIWIIIPKFLLLFTITFFCSCSNDEQELKEPSYVSCDEVAFCDSLIYELQTLVENKVNKTITEKFDFFSINSWRMIKDSFWEEDSIRKKEWAEAFKANGLDAKNFIDFINVRIETFNSLHESQLSPVVLSEFNDTTIINSQAFQDVENLDLIGAVDVIDVVFTFIPIIPYILWWIIGLVVGYILTSILLKLGFDVSEEGMGQFMGKLSLCLCILVYFFLIYHSIRLSAELESTVITNYINYLCEQNIPVQIFK